MKKIYHKRNRLFVNSEDEARYRTLVRDKIFRTRSVATLRKYLLYGVGTASRGQVLETPQHFPTRVIQAARKAEGEMYFAYPLRGTTKKIVELLDEAEMF